MIFGLGLQKHPLVHQVANSNGLGNQIKLHKSNCSTFDFGQVVAVEDITKATIASPNHYEASHTHTALQPTTTHTHTHTQIVNLHTHTHTLTVNLHKHTDVELVSWRFDVATHESVEETRATSRCTKRLFSCKKTVSQSRVDPPSG